MIQKKYGIKSTVKLERNMLDFLIGIWRWERPSLMMKIWQRCDGESDDENEVDVC